MSIGWVRTVRLLLFIALMLFSGCATTLQDADRRIRGILESIKNETADSSHLAELLTDMGEDEVSALLVEIWKEFESSPRVAVSLFANLSSAFSKKHIHLLINVGIEQALRYAKEEREAKPGIVGERWYDLLQWHLVVAARLGDDEEVLDHFSDIISDEKLPQTIKSAAVGALNFTNPKKNVNRKAHLLSNIILDPNNSDWYKDAAIFAFSDINHPFRESSLLCALFSVSERTVKQHAARILLNATEGKYCDAVFASMLLERDVETFIDTAESLCRVGDIRGLYALVSLLMRLMHLVSGDVNSTYAEVAENCTNILEYSVVFGKMFPYREGKRLEEKEYITTSALFWSRWWKENERKLFYDKSSKRFLTSYEGSKKNKSTGHKGVSYGIAEKEVVKITPISTMRKKLIYLAISFLRYHP